MGSIKSNISKEKLLKAGWIETTDSCFPVKKVIPNRNPINNSEDSEINLVLHGMYNGWTFAVLFPDGGLLNFVANSMDELTEFEEKINFYDPSF